MKYIRIFIRLLTLVLFLALAPAAVATTWYVDGVNGNDNNDCKSPQTACKTIGHAISLASSSDTIMVAPATYTENLTVNFNLKIIGADPTTTIVDGNQAGTVVTIPSTTAIVTLSKLTIQNGDVYPGNGGGIYNLGMLTINRGTISGNSGYEGGGIYSNGTLTINNSTISGNSGSYGGGIVCEIGSRLTINNTTISGNSASEYGGGIVNWGATSINNSTIVGNSAPVRTGGGIHEDSWWWVTLQNSIVANNSGRNCSSGTGITSNGYNLSSDYTCNFNGPGDMNNTKPKLGKLGNHGGPTQTIPEALASPTVDAGNPNGCTDGQGHLLTTDQRGYPRPGAHKTKKICDMGAFERQTD